MSEDLFNIGTTATREREAYNLIVDVFLTDTWTQALAHAMNILSQRHPDKAPHELLTLILVSGICTTIDEEHKTTRRRQSDFRMVQHGLHDRIDRYAAMAADEIARLATHHRRGMAQRFRKVSRDLRHDQA